MTNFPTTRSTDIVWQLRTLYPAKAKDFNRQKLRGWSTYLQ